MKYKIEVQIYANDSISTICTDFREDLDDIEYAVDLLTDYGIIHDSVIETSYNKGWLHDDEQNTMESNGGTLKQ